MTPQHVELPEVAQVLGDVELDRDRELVHRFQRGDVAAFDELYGNYFDRLRRYCSRRLRDPALAEDVAQEAFTRAYRALPALAGERRFYPWLTVIASRLCIDTIRKDGRSVPMADPPVVEAETTVGPEDAAMDAVDRQHLAIALAGIRPRYREVLELREHAGLSTKEIADHEGSTVGSIEVALCRARQALRQRFEAVAGAGRDALVTLPLLPGLARRLRSVALRLNVDPEIPAGAVVGALAAAAIVMGAAGAPERRAEQLLVGRPPAAASAPADAAPLPDVPAPELDSGGAGSARAAAPSDAEPAADSAPVAITSADEAKRRGQDSPVTAEADRAFVGLDPVEALSELGNKMTGYAEQLGGDE